MPHTIFLEYTQKRPPLKEREDGKKMKDVSSFRDDQNRVVRLISNPPIFLFVSEQCDCEPSVSEPSGRYLLGTKSTARARGLTAKNVMGGPECRLIGGICR